MKWNRILVAMALGASLTAGGIMVSPAYAQHERGEHGGWEDHHEGHGDWHGHWGIGVELSPGWGPGWGYGPGYYGYGYPYGYAYPYGYGYGYAYPNYPPVVVTVPAPQPPVYVEQGDATAQSGNSGYYWYHCDHPNGYYPYIKQCPDGWQRVVPQAPPSTR